MKIMRSRQDRGRHIGAYASAVAAVSVVVLSIVFHQYLASVVGGLLAHATPSDTEKYALLPKSVLASRLADAEAELERIRYQGALYMFIAEEDAALKASLGVPSEEVAARGRVIARPPRTSYDTLLVTVSPDADVVVGDYAYAGGTLVGDVVSRNQNTALVSLFSSPGRTFDGRIGTPDAIVVVHGQGGGAFTFELSKEVVVAVGDPVMSAHGEQALVARVAAVIDEPERTTFTVHAASPVGVSDMDVIEFVHALTESGESGS